MRRVAIVIAVFLLAAGCRAGFPSLNDAPEAAPPKLVAARDAALADRARLQHMRAGMQPPPAPVEKNAVRPARLLAALPANAAAPEGVIDRAIAAARESGRRLEIVGVGPAGADAAARLAARFRARGLAPGLSAVAQRPDAPNGVELYLSP